VRVWCLRVVVALVGLVGVSWGLAGAASGFASVEGPPVASAVHGLPDGRVYEQVSPVDKNGNEAGATTSPYQTGALKRYGWAARDGEAVLFEGTGPMGESPWGDSVYFVATKNVGRAGWSTRALQPRDVQPISLLDGKDDYFVDPSQDLSHALVEAEGDGLGPRPNEACDGPIYLVGSDPFVEGTWLERPSAALADPVEGCGENGAAGVPVGGSPDFTTVYFAYAGTLLPEDASRSAYAGGEAWGFYEYTGGVLAEAGVLPNGQVSPFGAVPAASGHGRNPAGNQVSEDGTRAFFVSPDPDSCTEEHNGQNNCAQDPPELYVRIDGRTTLLVSKDTLLPEVGGLPVGAPDSIIRMPNPSSQYVTSLDGSWVFASPDGSQAFFESRDALTEAAREASPGNEPKTYDFDVDTGSLTYLPGVSGEILGSSRDGSVMAFLSPESGGQPPELQVWKAGGSGGSVTPVVALAAPGSVPVTRVSADGSALVFQTSQDLSGSFNTGGFEEIYRYDVAANSLGCVSCPPVGVAPRGNASMSVMYSNEIHALGSIERVESLADDGNVSANGQRIFFESPDPLVAGDSNTNSPPAPERNEGELEPQGRDVYEWENDVVYLISSGTSTRDSYLLDSSENGDDVFFATAQGLAPSDTDGGYDVYDARVPRSGEDVTRSPTGCEGDSCEGSAKGFEGPVAPLSPGGSGNPAPESTSTPTTAKPQAKPLKCRRGYVKRKGRCVRARSKTAGRIRR
jgi:hypothetical protein